MTLLEKNSVNSGKGGGLKVSVIIAIRERIDWMCCNPNEEGEEVT